MINVLSIVLNNFTHDARVLKECITLQKAGYNISVLALHDDSKHLLESEIILGVDVKRIRLVSKSWSKNALIQLIKYIEFIVRAQSICIRADILHCNDLDALIVGVVAKILSLGRLKIIYDAHELEREALSDNKFGKKMLEFLEKNMLILTNKVITVTPSIVLDYSDHYGIKKPDLVLNSPAWQEKIPQGNIFREKYDISYDQKIFLYQGRLSMPRGLRELVEAFSTRSKKDAVLIFMGYGPAEAYLQEVSSKYNNIFLHPAVPPEEILNYTCGADYGLIFLHTNNNKSYYYCLPNKFFEFATCGLPFLSNDLHDIGIINEKYHLGKQVKNMSPDEINRGIDELLAENYDELSKNARLMAKDHCWEQQEKTLLDVYQKVLNDK